MCVFHQESYINLLKLLVTSISEKAHVDLATTDILVITSPGFHPLIQKELASINLPIQYHILDLHTLMEASCCKLKIFQYHNIDKYDKILYLDTDVLINSDVNVLFNIDISPDKVYALEEGIIGHEFWGGQFFDFSVNNPHTPAYSAGVLYFRNSPAMKELFTAANTHIASHMQNNSAPVCLDQPFLLYHSFTQQKYDNQLMKSYMENNPSMISTTKIIYHFPGGPGDYASKHDKMTSFWGRMQTHMNVFNTRNDMLKHYLGQRTSPKMVEIGVFKGDFLDYLVRNCSIGTIDAVDLFEGDTCSGDADGNNVVYYNVGKSYLELSEKYRDDTRVRLQKSDSVTFLQNQPDDTYDIVYIDGDHSYNGVKQDLRNAYKKIKNGGYIMGHDYEMNMSKAHTYYNFGVKAAVDEFCKEYNQIIVAKAIDGCVSFCIHITKPA
jgi:hypothetical protein